MIICRLCQAPTGVLIPRGTLIEDNLTVCENCAKLPANPVRANPFDTANININQLANELNIHVDEDGTETEYTVRCMSCGDMDSVYYTGRVNQYRSCFIDNGQLYVGDMDEEDTMESFIECSNCGSQDIEGNTQYEWG